MPKFLKEMRYIKYLQLLLVAVSFMLFFKLLYIISKILDTRTSQKNNKDFFIMSYSKFVPILGIVCSLFFVGLLALMIKYPNDTGGTWVAMIFIPFILLGLFIVFFSIRWKAHIYENRIIYISIWGPKYEFKYSEIEYVKITNATLSIKIARKTLHFSLSTIGIDVLLKQLKDKNVVVKE